MAKLKTFTILATRSILQHRRVMINAENDESACKLALQQVIDAPDIGWSIIPFSASDPVTTDTHAFPIHAPIPIF